MPTYGGFEEGKRIMEECNITPQFISGLLDGRPSFASIYKWSNGTPMGDGQRVLDLLRRLKALQDKSSLPYRFTDVAKWKTALRTLDVLEIRLRMSPEEDAKSMIAHTPQALNPAGLVGEGAK
jgi:hypothetical protein